MDGSNLDAFRKNEIHLLKIDANGFFLVSIPERTNFNKMEEIRESESIIETHDDCFSRTIVTRQHTDIRHNIGDIEQLSSRRKVKQNRTQRDE